MAQNHDKIIEKYTGAAEDNRATSSRSTAEEFRQTERLLAPYMTASARVAEIGCGTGYYARRFASRVAAYTAIDLVPDHIACLREHIAAEQLHNITAEVGDATDLSGLTDGAFDVVLCLGPMYHLAPDERARAMAECQRILRPGGIAAFAYINRLGVYAGGVCNYPTVYPNPRTNHFVLDRSVDDVNPDLFFFTSPAEMAALAAANGLTVERQAGLDFFFAASVIDRMTDEQFACWRALGDRMSDSDFCAEAANHALMLCRREG